MFTLCMWRIEVICLDNVVPASCHELAVFRKFGQYVGDVKRKFRQIAVNVLFHFVHKTVWHQNYHIIFYLGKTSTWEEIIGTRRRIKGNFTLFKFASNFFLNFSYLFHFSASLFDPFLFAQYKPLIPRNGWIEALGKGHLDRQ